MRIGGKVKKKMVERLGYLDDLEKQFADPLAHFRKEAIRLTRDAKCKNMSSGYSAREHFDFSRSFDRDSDISHESSCLVHSYGVLPLLWAYRDLEIDHFLNIKRQYKDVRYNLNHVFQLLVFGRILCPDSKLRTWRDRNRLLFSADFSDDDVYRSLEFFSSVKTDMIRHLNNQLAEKNGKKTSLVYYDVISYSNEADDGHRLKKGRFSHEHKPEPMIHMGLFMDSEGLPVTYDLIFSSTLNETKVRPMMNGLSGDPGNKNLIHVADEGVMSGIDIAQLVLDNKGYVAGDSLSKAPMEMKDYVLNRDGYTESKDGSFLYKSRILPREIIVETCEGTCKTIVIKERQIVFRPEKHLERNMDESEKVPSNNPDIGHGHDANHAHIKKLISDSAAAEEKTVGKKQSSQEELDSYCLIRTNIEGICEDSSAEVFNGNECRWHDNGSFLELNRPVPDTDIIDIFRGLLQIENSFSITKNILKSRPVYVHNSHSIDAHFLSCFVAILILRLLERKVGNRIPLKTIVESLRKANLAMLPDGTYMSTYCDNVITDIGKALNLDLSGKYYSASDMKKLRGKTRKAVPIKKTGTVAGTCFTA